MCVALTAPSILCHASSILSSSAWSSFLGFVCWIYNLMHCFLDLLRSKMASWLSREGAGVAGLVHVWNPLVNRACLKNCSHYTSIFKHGAYWTNTKLLVNLACLKNCSATPTAHTTQAFSNIFCAYWTSTKLC